MILRTMGTRLVVAAWLALFLWWCLAGASLMLASREHEEPAMWVGPLSIPWVVAGSAVGALAIWKPSRWTAGLFGVPPSCRSSWSW